MSKALLWSLDETAQQLGGVSVRTVRRMIERDELPEVRVGRRRLAVPAAAVHDWVDRNMPHAHNRQCAGPDVRPTTEKRTCQKSADRTKDGIYRRTDSPYWWASFTDARGRRTRRSTGTADRQEAEALLSKWRLEAHREKHWDEQPTRTFDELMLAYMQGPGQEKRSTERDRFSALKLYPFFSGRELNDLSGVDVRDYIAGRRKDGVGPGTINREIGLLSSALNWARRELEWDVPNPAQNRRMREPAGRARWLTRAEAAALIQAARTNKRAPHLADFIVLGLHTGLRPGEMLELEWRRVDLHSNLVHLEARNQKSGRLGAVPLNRSARSALLSRARFRAKYRPDNPWVFCNRRGERIANIKRSFAQTVDQAGLSDVHPHDLRRTCGSWLVQDGVPLSEVAALLRHSDIRVTVEHYAHLAPENIRAAVARLEDTMSRSGHAENEKSQSDVL